MNDEELREVLRSAVPEHGDGFWDAMDRGLRAVGNTGLRLAPEPAPTPVTGVPVAPVTGAPVVAESDGGIPAGGEEAAPFGRPRGGVEPIGPARTPAAHESAAIPWRTEDMSHQQRRPGGARGVVESLAGLNKVAVAAAVLVALVGGLFYGVGRAGVFTTRSVSWQESASTQATPDVTGRTTQPSTPSVSPTGSSAPVASSQQAPEQTTRAPGQAVQSVLGTASDVVTAATGLSTRDALAMLSLADVDVVGTPVRALTWNDRNGRNVLLVTREVVKDVHGAVVAVKAHLFVVAQLGTVVRLLGSTVEKASVLNLAKGLLTVGDCNHDGIAEVTVGLVSGVVDGLTRVTLIVHVLTAGKDYVLRGTGLPESTVASLDPTALLQLPTSLLTTVLSAVPVAGAWPDGCYGQAQATVDQYLH